MSSCDNNNNGNNDSSRATDSSRSNDPGSANNSGRDMMRKTAKRITYMNDVIESLKKNGKSNNLSSTNTSGQELNEQLVDDMKFSDDRTQNGDPDEDTQLKTNQELKFINMRLENYINTVKEITETSNLTPKNDADDDKYMRNMLMKPNSRSNLCTNGAVNGKLHIKYNSEKDFELMRQLYEEELKLLKLEIEELSAARNKYSLDNFNLELKLKDFITKFEDIKRTNEELENELNQSKSRLNRAEFELDSSRLESEKYARENKQLKKDLDDLISKVNEKQAISDSEIAYRQEIEIKFKELNDSYAFERKLSEQEIENLKSQLKLSQDTILEYELKLNETLNKENTSTETFALLKTENNTLKLLNKQLEEQNNSLKFMCKSLENAVSNFEDIRKSLEEQIAKSQRTSVNSEINSIKTKLDAEEVRLLKLASFSKSNRSSAEPPYSRFSFRTNNTDELVNEFVNQTNNPPFASPADQQQNKLKGYSVFLNNDNFLNRKLSVTEDLKLLKQQQQQPQQDNKHVNNQPRQHIQQVKFIDTSNDNIVKAREYHHPRSASPSNYMVNSSGSSSPLLSPNSNSQSQQPEHKELFIINKNMNKQTNGGGNVRVNKNYCILEAKDKDHTKELFNNFEKTVLFENGKPKKELNSNMSVSSIDNNTVTEASYIGNIKIHEVNKNGYYIRLLNVSNTLEEDVSNYTIQQTVSNLPVAVYRLPQPTKIAPGHTITIWSRTDEVEQQPPHTFVWYEQDRWGTGAECTTILAKPNGQAVSWTTGCHKYGNVALKDFDEIVPVYAHKRNKITDYLERDKLTPHKIYAPTKHPHGFHKKDDEPEDETTTTTRAANQLNNNRFIQKANAASSQNGAPKRSETPNSGFQRSFFATQRSRPCNSATTNRSKATTVTTSSTGNYIKAHIEDSTSSINGLDLKKTQKENFTYFQNTTNNKKN